MKNLPYDRSERVADAIYQLAAMALVNELTDPRLKGVSITRVRVTKDLRIARIYFHTLKNSDEVKNRAELALKSAAGFMRRRIAESLSLRFTPDVEFYYDESIDIGERIDELMAGIREGGS